MSEFVRSNPLSRVAGLLLCATAVITAAESAASGIAPFTSDGCSLFPDRSLIGAKEWCDCCVEHDLAYWQGGSREQRARADDRLRQCVVDKTGDAVLAQVMYQGVRLGGSPYFATWYRWGYGWSDGRKYRVLTEAEHADVTWQLAGRASLDPVTTCAAGSR